MGLSNIHSHKITHIPIDEALSLLRLNVQFLTIAKGDWVRLKSGTYHNDIALVTGASPNFDTICVATIPRLNLTGVKPAKRKQLSDARPPKRLFDPEETIKLYGKDSVKKCNQVFLYDNQIFKNGLLELEVRSQDVEYQPEPTSSELWEFSQSLTVTPRDIQTALASRMVRSICVGDRIEVLSGDWKGRVGVLKSLDSDHAGVQFTDRLAEGLPVILLPTILISKSFQVWDYVLVREGLESGKSGWVLSRQPPRITFYDRNARKEVSLVPITFTMNHKLTYIPQVTVMAWDLDFSDVEISKGTPTEDKVIHARHDPHPFDGRQVIAHQGHLKAYRGIVKSVNVVRGTAQVELEAGQRRRYFQLTDLFDPSK